MSRFRSVLQSPSFWLGVFLLAVLIIGLNIFQDYGVSFDEPGIYHFAPVSLDMYSTAFHPPERPVYLKESFLRRSGIPTDLFNYGPFYFMAVELFVRSLQTLGIKTDYWDLWHLAYFVTFEAGILIFYLLGRRWLSGWAALGAAILFATQPLIFGHTFINPKDLPFMVFFMGTVYTGLLMVDKLGIPQQASPRQTLKELPALLHAERSSIRSESLIKFRRQILFITGVIVLLILMHPLWSNVLQQTMSRIHSAPSTSLPGSVLRAFSNNPEKISTEDLIRKSQIWLTRLEFLIILSLVGGMIWLTHRLLPRSGHLIGQFIFRPIRLFLSSLINPWIILAAVFFGFTLSIRLFAPLAAGLVFVYLFWKLERQAILPSLAYVLIAWIVTYLTWPYLWGAPIKHLVKSWQVMNAFSNPGSWTSLPTLLATQYTVPAVLLALAGIMISIWEFVRGKRSGLFLLFLGWSILPLSVLILRKSFLYDNFRQVLFVIPPFFMIAGVTIERINTYLKHPALIGLFILLISLPGIRADVKLHPYQYVYYNEFVPGKKSEFWGYNGDYWGISQKEIVDFLNAVAPANATVKVCSIPLIFDSYIRKDLRIDYTCKTGAEAGNAADYIVITSSKSLDTIPYPQTDVVYTVGRENAIYGVVIAVPSQSK